MSDQQRTNPTDWWLIGGTIDARSVRNLERRLIVRPDDLEARITLIGYHSRRQYRQRKSLIARRRLLAWLVKFRPTMNLTHGWLATYRSVDCVGYRMLERLWQRALDRLPGDLRVIANAADFLTGNDDRRAVALLERGARLDPNNAYWLEELAHIHDLNRRPRKQLACLERARQLGKKAPDARMITSLARAALAAKECRKASSWARKQRAQVPMLERTRMHGNAWFWSHTVLGHLALARGKLDVAEQHLLAAGTTAVSPQLNSFGPDFTLAQVLLRRGRTAAVVEYLRRCARFWSGRQPGLERCIAEIESGKRPRMDRLAFLE